MSVNNEIPPASAIACNGIGQNTKHANNSFLKILSCYYKINRKNKERKRLFISNAERRKYLKYETGKGVIHLHTKIITNANNSMPVDKKCLICL